MASFLTIRGGLVSLVPFACDSLLSVLADNRVMDLFLGQPLSQVSDWFTYRVPDQLPLAK